MYFSVQKNIHADLFVAALSFAGFLYNRRINNPVKSKMAPDIYMGNGIKMAAIKPPIAAEEDSPNTNKA